MEKVLSVLISFFLLGEQLSWFDSLSIKLLFCLLGLSFVSDSFEPPSILKIVSISGSNNFSNTSIVID